MIKPKYLSEDEVVRELKNWFEAFIAEADADDLARFAGETFGGVCIAGDEDDLKGNNGFPEYGSDIVYEFTPNGNYYGQFGDISEFESEE